MSWLPGIGRGRGWLLLAGVALLAVILVLVLARGGFSPGPETTATVSAGAQARASTSATPSPRAASGTGAVSARVTSTSLPRPTVTPAPAKTAAGSTHGLAIPTPLPGERLPTIAFDRLPPEARTVIRLIAAGGPFPYRQDGATFQNRESLLPRKSSDYYREYTVETPGSSDRGARRIVAGQQGELYYTDDHYASFRRVTP